MLCSFNVHHISPRGPHYLRTHAVWLSEHMSLDDAVQSVGAVPPQNVEAVRVGNRIRYPHALAVALDPDHIIVHLQGMPGGAYVSVPYQCTLHELMQTVIPSRLLQLGVHPHDAHGAPLERTRPQDIWCNCPAPICWAKLRVPVQFQMPPHVVRGLVRFQRRWRHVQDGYELVN